MEDQQCKDDVVTWSLPNTTFIRGKAIPDPMDVRMLTKIKQKSSLVP